MTMRMSKNHPSLSPAGPPGKTAYRTRFHTGRDGSRPRFGGGYYSSVLLALAVAVVAAGCTVVPVEKPSAMEKAKLADLEKDPIYTEPVVPGATQVIRSESLGSEITPAQVTVVTQIPAGRDPVEELTALLARLTGQGVTMVDLKCAPPSYSVYGTKIVPSSWPYVKEWPAGVNVYAEFGPGDHIGNIRAPLFQVVLDPGRGGPAPTPTAVLIPSISGDCPPGLRLPG
jgi:hypothetical protein